MSDSPTPQPTPTRDSQVTLVEITEDNLRPVMDLKVTEEQDNFVAPNSVSIAEHCYADESWMKAIYADGIPVGFVLLSERRQVPRYYLWRYMIDARYQGLGFGAQAMGLVIDYVRTLPNAESLYLSYVPEPGGPRDFYAGLGFEDTGRESGGEREMILAL
ncbi:MAG: GNAT family N-acetyltransferase [Acidimicrobiia bacterium]